MFRRAGAREGGDFVAGPTQSNATTAISESASDVASAADPDLPLCGKFAQSGRDRVLTDDSQEIVLGEDCADNTRAALGSTHGGIFPTKMVAAPVRPDDPQGTAPADDVGPATAHIVTTTGKVTILHGAGTVEGTRGAALFRGDVIKTGADGAVAIALLDGTVFTLAGADRMALTELADDPNSAGSSVGLGVTYGRFTYLRGNFSVQAGATDKIDLSSFHLNDCAELRQLTEPVNGGHDRLINLRHGDSILIANVAPSQLTQKDFILQHGYSASHP